MSTPTLHQPAPSASAISQAVAALRAGQLVGLPTETVYGLAGDACNDQAVAAIFALKGRPSDHPLIVHVHDAAAANAFAAQVPDFAQRLMDAFWPGPLTLILPRRAGVAQAAAGGQSSIGLRCPAHPLTQALLRDCAQAGIAGLAAPSANRFGRVSPTTAEHVRQEFGPDLLVLDGGPCALGIESTLVDCTRGQPVVLRPGAITRQQVAQAALAADTPAQSAPAATAPRASGTLQAHYAPNAKVRLMDAQSLQAALDLLCAAHRAQGARQHPAAAPAVAVWARSTLRLPQANRVALLRRMPPTPAAAAQQLFATLREFDALKVPLVWVEAPPDTPEWEAVRDRLLRAQAAGQTQATAHQA